MVMIKKCISEGCSNSPNFGFKANGQNDLVWACKTHQRLIWLPVVKAAVAELVTDLRKAETAEQGRLL
jgi:hypothetical protein